VLHVGEVEVPELTRSATIKLNARLSLQRDLQSIALPALAIHRKDHINEWQQTEE
jgi:hypothetical protein